MCRNTYMYGFADPDDYVAAVYAAGTYKTRGLSAVVLDEIAHAEQAIELDPAAARQALNRARFLITRLCPLATACAIEALAA